MAFFGNDAGLCRDKWPQSMAMDAREAGAQNVLASWRTIPCDFEELSERVVVDDLGTRSPVILMSHPDLEADDKRVAFTVRLQGIVGEVNLKVLGDWNGEDTGAPKALQTLVLVAGGGKAAFDAQRSGVLHLEEVILAALSAPFHGDLGRKGTIRLTRRVFTKIDTGDTINKVSISKREDPNDRAGAISDRWYVDHRIRAKVQEGGIATNKPTMAIRKGDFVDVACSVEVVTMRGKAGRRTEVKLCPHEVVRLKTAREANAIFRNPATVASSGGIKRPDIQYVFDEVDEDTVMT